VSYVRPSQLVVTSLASAPRCEDGSKPILETFDTFPASKVDGVLVKDAYFHLECELHAIQDGYGVNSLVIGEVVEAHASRAALRVSDRDGAELLANEPLMAYVSPGRYARVTETFAFPFPEGFSK
jgi:flavin reductase (DIM6/NTAB) family NADH-FMN oxidoreductase RutF